MSTQYASQDMAQTLQITTHTYTPRVVHIHTHTHTLLAIKTVRPAQRRHAHASLWHDMHRQLGSNMYNTVCNTQACTRAHHALL
jgi:hypothetical protein